MDHMFDHSKLKDKKIKDVFDYISEYTVMFFVGLPILWSFLLFQSYSQFSNGRILFGLMFTVPAAFYTLMCLNSFKVNFGYSRLWVISSKKSNALYLYEESIKRLREKHNFDKKEITDFLNNRYHNRYYYNKVHNVIIFRKSRDLTHFLLSV